MLGFLLVLLVVELFSNIRPVVVVVSFGAKRLNLTRLPSLWVTGTWVKGLILWGVLGVGSLRSGGAGFFRCLMASSISVSGAAGVAWRLGFCSHSGLSRPP